MYILQSQPSIGMIKGFGNSLYSTVFPLIKIFLIHSLDKYWDAPPVKLVQYSVYCCVLVQ